MDQEGLEGLDSFTLARRVWIEATRRAVMPPMAPPPAPMSLLSAMPVASSTSRGLQEADQARAFQAAWEAGWKAAEARVGSKAGTCVPRLMWSSGTRIRGLTSENA